MSIRLIPNSTALRRTAMAPARSAGSPHTPRPVSCIAPNPSRWTGSSPFIATVPLLEPALHSLQADTSSCQHCHECGARFLECSHRSSVCSSVTPPWSSVYPIRLEVEYALPTVIFRAACPSGFDSRATRRETWTIRGHTPTMMHASFQIGCHDSIDVLWVIFICLLHPVKHACFQTISSKEDNDELSSTRSVIGAQMRDVGRGLSIT